MDSPHREEQLMQQWKLRTFIEKSFRLKQRTVVVSLDAKGAFDAAWWPSILKQLRKLKCPKIYTIYQQVTSAIGKQHYQ